MDRPARDARVVTFSGRTMESSLKIISLCSGCGRLALV
jgi:hypothetical protein